ncbi:DNA-processing protein DprA [Neobacillus mesonae]|uniref:DNA processing protein DprA n=1 Tax=Neobacillus mesonae TaxID=1193713 RepID=A0A3T0HZV6_9BACI|nr:DNA-processing protein DprA [Neobacillus mesonae]AZU62567.1 DNA processing protein DprA [Neobacillus mesonae]
MNFKESIFILYDLGISLTALSKLYREANLEQLIDVLNGNFLSVQFSLGVFNDKDIELLSSMDALDKSKSYTSKLLIEFKEKEIQYYSYYEDGYPQSLKGIPSPPFFIFLKGNLRLLENRFICSVVGTRNPSEQIIAKIERTVNEMVSAGVVIVSGLALGTDICVHRSTLKNKGKTIAVLPSSLDNIIPKGHEKDADEIIKKDGLLISEYYKSETFHKKTNYIHRNRIISGLSNAILITECSDKSGTMHTARFAYKQRRPLYCFDNQSTGVRKLLDSNSACVYTNLKDLPM